MTHFITPGAKRIGFTPASLSLLAGLLVAAWEDLAGLLRAFAQALRMIGQEIIDSLKDCWPQREMY